MVCLRCYRPVSVIGGVLLDTGGCAHEVEESWRLCHLDARFEVSDVGRVRVRESGKLLPQNVQVRIDGSQGYLKTNLPGRPEARGVRPIPRRPGVYVHQLVAHAFWGQARRPGQVVDHRNCDRWDNRAANLRWVSHVANLRHEPEPEDYGYMSEEEERAWTEEMRAAGW